MGILTDAVNIASSVTDGLGLQSTVTHEAIAGLDGYGNKLYAAPVSRLAVVEMKQKSVKTASGEMDVSQASVLFLDPTLIIDSDDRITLPNGMTGPILTLEGFMNPETGQPALTQVYLG